MRGGERKKPFKEEFYVTEHPLNSNTDQGSSNGANKGFKWLRKSSGISGESHLDNCMLCMS